MNNARMPFFVLLCGLGLGSLATDTLAQPVTQEQEEIAIRQELQRYENGVLSIDGFSRDEIAYFLGSPIPEYSRWAVRAVERGFESEDPRLLWHVVLLLGYPEVRTPKNKERLLQILETATDWPLVSSATNEIGVFECSSAELPRIIEAAKTIDRRCGSLHPPELEDNLLNHAAGAVGEAAYLPLREYIGARATAHKRREFWQEDERILLSTRHPQAIREVLSDLKEKKLADDTPHHHRGPVDWIFGEVKGAILDRRIKGLDEAQTLALAAEYAALLDEVAAAEKYPPDFRGAAVLNLIKLGEISPEIASMGRQRCQGTEAIWRTTKQAEAITKALAEMDQPKKKKEPAKPPMPPDSLEQRQRAWRAVYRSQFGRDVPPLPQEVK